MAFSLRFDKQDFIFLSQVKRAIELNRAEHASAFPYTDALHPNGIIDLAIPAEMRMASAVLRLLDSLEQGQEKERLRALRALRDEVMVSARTNLRRNTGRVLIQIMKEIVRAQGDDERQIRLAHDFRQTASGKPSVVRRMLRRYFLLEMPEEWNQAVFDHHVHDANTKGRKNATHLIMDAWVKGIRSLTVIYYHFVRPEAARELMDAAEIMGVSVRIGLLFHAPYQGGLLDFIWIPRGFSDAEGFLAFLAEPGVRRLMEKGREASDWMERHILSMLEQWNSRGRHELERELGIVTEELDREKFLAFVGAGQTFLLHLAEFIHASLLSSLREEAAALSERLNNPECDEACRAMLEQRLHRLNNCTTEYLMEVLRRPTFKTERERLTRAPSEENCGGNEGKSSEDCPELLRTPPLMLLDWLSGLHSGNRIVLNLARLSPEDVLNLLWDCQGLITHLEIFNLKDWQEGKEPHLAKISELQQAINNGSAPLIKQLIRRMLRDCEENRAVPFPWPVMPDCETRAEKLRLILRNIPILQGFYAKFKIYSRIGTDSSSRPGQWYGMGLAFPETLPPRARRELGSRRSTRLWLPLSVTLKEHLIWKSIPGEERRSLPLRLLRALPGLRHFLRRPEREWTHGDANVHDDGKCCAHNAKSGNVVTLGGMGRPLTNGFLPAEGDGNEAAASRCINTTFANVLKVLGGFIPAWAAFMLTQDNALLMWLGAPLWFLITGLRNIMQAVLGGGGFHRSPLLRWNDYVSWSRLCDSLLYTGISVILLELALRVWFLQDFCRLDPVRHDVLIFSVISLVNGFYIAGHNYLRGFPREVIIANIFRSVFAIPVALAYNEALELILRAFGTADPQTALFSVAAITSKVASDTVAGIIEGMADRNSNMRLRLWDYRSKLHKVFSLYGRLELLYPEQDVSDMLKEPSAFLARLDQEHRPLKPALIANALDLMYFWFYQPRAAHALKKITQGLSGAERLALLRSQKVLEPEKDVCQLLVDGLTGRNFARALSFYLDRRHDYLRAMEKLLSDQPDTEHEPA